MPAMNDAAAAKLQKRIMALGDKWVLPLGFGNWRVTHEYFREGIPPLDASDLVADSKVLMRVTTIWEYMRVNIMVDLTQLDDIEDDELERNYLHELGHAFLSIVLDTPKEGRARAVEHVATMLGNAFFYTRQWGKDDAKRERKAKKKAKTEAAARALVESTT